MLSVLMRSSEQRLRQIAQARQAVLLDGTSLPGGLADPWIVRSWRRCLASGKKPEQEVAFDVIAPQALRRTEEANHLLVQAARPVLDRLGAAIASTRYFAILTNAEGVVVDVSGPVDRQDRRADLITRIGVDLSERSVGTTAIGAALTELRRCAAVRAGWPVRGHAGPDRCGCGGAARAQAPGFAVGTQH